MANPTFNGFSLQDDNYITSRVEHHTAPARGVRLAKITAQPGSLQLGEEFGEKRIKLSGHILGSDAIDLRSKIDDLNKNVVKEVAKTLTIDSNRSYTATCSQSVISDPAYAVDYVPFELEFICADPFAYGDTHNVNWTVASGTTTTTKTVTISGSVFAEPTITFTSVGTSGYTTTSGIRLAHTNSGTFTAWSGTISGPKLAYGNFVAFNYGNQTVTTSGVSHDYSGNMLSRWEPEPNEFTVTFSGTTQGGTLALAYQPRYIS